MLIFPMLFMGILGGSLAQNLGTESVEQPLPVRYYFGQ